MSTCRVWNAFHPLRLTFRLTNGAAVQLTGRLVLSPASGQSHELLVNEKDGGNIKILGECDPEVQVYETSFVIFTNIQN